MTLGLPVSALIFRDGPSPAANTETAPTGVYADSGWQYQIRFASFHGTMVSPKHFITAVHLGAGQTEISQPMHFNGVEDKTYTIRPGSRTVIGTTDLAIFEIWESFDTFAPLYSRSDEAGRELVVMGRGFGRGSELSDRGWTWGPAATRRSRWGRNTVGGALNAGGNDLLFFDFSDVLGQDEVAGTGGDSGGGVFIRDGQVWKLAGVNFSVDSLYSQAAVPANSNAFRGSLYEAGGIFLGNDANGWNRISSFGNSLNPASSTFFRQSNTYASRISSSLPAIQAVIDPALALSGLSSGQRFEAWLTGAGIAAGSTAAGDADSDGISNLEEYLSDSDPSDAGDGQRPFTVEFLLNGDHRFTLVESLDLEGRGLTTEIQSSPDLLTWTAVSDAAESANTPDNSLGVRTRVLERTPNEAGALYYRLEITLSTP